MPAQAHRIRHSGTGCSPRRDCPPQGGAVPTSLAGAVSRLQRQAGNRAVSRLLQRQQLCSTPPGPLETYELTLPEFSGNARVEQAKLNAPVLKRQTDTTGPAVYAIQKALILAGHRMPRSTKANDVAASLESPNDPTFTDRARDPDGRWGDETDGVLQQFQRDHALCPDARVGNKTLKALQDAATTPVPVPILPTGTRIAGVESFSVTYSRDPAQDGRIRIDVTATFKDDQDHDPAAAEYQQFVSSRATSRLPDGGVSQTPTTLLPVHDDGWHRDPGRINNRPQTYSGNTFSTFDVAGFNPIAPDEVLDFRFTAEQRIVDLARNGRIVARRGPHTVVVKGRAPRRYTGLPLEL